MNSEGAFPRASLIVSGNTFYGAAEAGGERLPFPDQNVILTWPTNTGGFSLQSTPEFAPAVWSAVSPAPVVINGQNTVTNSVSGAKGFYRLN